MRRALICSFQIGNRQVKIFGKCACKALGYVLTALGSWAPRPVIQLSVNGCQTFES